MNKEIKCYDSCCQVNVAYELGKLKLNEKFILFGKRYKLINNNSNTDNVIDFVEVDEQYENK